MDDSESGKMDLEKENDTFTKRQFFGTLRLCTDIFLYTETL